MSERLCADLPEDRIREYCASQPIRRLSVFGSALRGELTPESDVDLLVEYLPDARIGYFELARQARELSDIVGREVDLATPNSLSPYIKQDVLNSARLLYAQEPSE